ncbi:PadR family transcriptional regulator [Lysobacter pythonis]|uniref:PadR family transcriptional regulator n=1 Tax=Solilutibacter pythonis TaxID=2483112 RepID=A0A3M2HV94_9GAMM|nr:PadR family transcriptional regulator [Lysobacter pythonis]RMH92948.1 PadR family transcriptional regulator [Lysobacter pythonis]
MNSQTDKPSDDELRLRKFQRELSVGTVALALLAVVARSGEPMYGYQIAKALEQAGGVLAGKQSALYPVLRNLEASGLLESFVEPSVSGPPRRYYRATGSGRATLRDWSEAWRATRDSVDAVLKGSLK